MSQAYIAKIDENLSEQICAALEFIGWRDIVQPDSTVFIKPNLTWPELRPGVTTSPAFVEALLGILTERAGRVILGESDGGTFSAEEAFANHGLPELCSKYGAELVNLSRRGAIKIEDTIAGRHIQIEASRLLLEEVDVFITLPVLKTHVVTKVTLGLKNQWGCIPNQKRLLYHHILDWGIVALNRAYAPKICILDGTYAMDRRGPLEGDPIPAGWLAVADNVVTLDALGCHLMGLSAQEVRHIRFAEDEGLGSSDLEQVNLNQPLPPALIQATIQPDLMDRIAIFLYRSYSLSKLTFDSPLTPILYKIIRRTPPGVTQPFHHASYASPADH